MKVSRLSLQGILFPILIFFAYDCNENPTDKVVQVSDSGLSFKLPRAWNKITGPNLDAYRQQVQEKNYAQARSLGLTDPEDFMIREFGMYSAAKDEKAAVVAIAMKIPSTPDKSYIEMMYENESGQIFSKFNKVNVFRITEIDKTPVLETDVEGGDGSRIISYNFWSPNSPSEAFLLLIIIAPGHYPEFKPVIDSLRRSAHLISK